MGNPDPRARAEDPRPARTRARILKAIEVLSQRGDPLTVSAIVTEAGISRSSFYAQYRDLDDVALRLMRHLYTHIETVDSDLRDRGLHAEATRRTTAMLIDAFDRHRVLYAAVLGPTMTMHFQHAILAIFAEGALSTLTQVQRTRHLWADDADVELAAEYLAGGTLAVLTRWLTEEFPVSAEQLQQRLAKCLPAWVQTRRLDTTGVVVFHSDRGANIPRASSRASARRTGSPSRWARLGCAGTMRSRNRFSRI